MLEENQVLLSTFCVFATLMFTFPALATMDFQPWLPISYGHVFPSPKGKKLVACLKAKKNQNTKNSSKFYSIGLYISTEPLTKSFLQNRNAGVSFEMSHISVSHATAKSAARANHQLWAQAAGYMLPINQPQ